MTGKQELVASYLRGFLNQTSEWGTQRDRCASFRLIISVAVPGFVSDYAKVASLSSEPTLLIQLRALHRAEQVQARSTGDVCCRLKLLLTDSLARNETHTQLLVLDRSKPN